MTERFTVAFNESDLGRFLLKFLDSKQNQFYSTF